LIAYYSDFVYEANPKVTSFKMTIISAGNIAEDYSSNSNMLTAQMKDRISRLRKNERVLFEDIKARGPDNQPRNLSPLAVKVD
jgi:hypothetical protein